MEHINPQFNYITKSLELMKYQTSGALQHHQTSGVSGIEPTDTSEVQ